jgi:hypothetical protein
MLHALSPDAVPLDPCGQDAVAVVAQDAAGDGAG